MSTAQTDYFALRHQVARRQPRPGIESLMALTLDNLRDYAQDFERRYGQPIGTDGVIGDEGWLRILRGLKTLLDAELDRLDAGALSTEILELAKMAGYGEGDL